MCIAIYKPLGKEIDEDTLRLCSENNPDGCGFAYINEDLHGVRRIKVRKAMDFDEFYRKYKKAVAENSSDFLIHFRIKTHGQVDLANCHPFYVDKKHVFIHNGTIGKVDKVDDMSDTRVFNRDVLRVLPKNWNKNSGIKALIEEFIGFSKLVVMDISGKVNIYNESKGEWDGDIWYSNTSYKPKPIVTTTSYTNVPRKAYGYTDRYPFRSDTSGGTVLGKDLNKITSKAGPAAMHRKTRFDIDTYIPCDLCGVYHPIKDIEAYWQGKTVIGFCKKCAVSDDVWYHFDQEDLISEESHCDWLNDLKSDDGQDFSLYTVMGEWENPWAQEDYMEEIADTEEGFEAAHQLMLDHAAYA